MDSIKALKLLNEMADDSYMSMNEEYEPLYNTISKDLIAQNKLKKTLTEFLYSIEKYGFSMSNEKDEKMFNELTKQIKR